MMSSIKYLKTFLIAYGEKKLIILEKFQLFTLIVSLISQLYFKF